MNNLLWMLTGTGADADAKGVTNEVKDIFTKNVWPWIQTILWILVAVLAVILIIKGITTALAVVKAADEPQVRQEKLGSFKYLAIGLGAAIIFVSLANIIVGLVLDNASADDLSSARLFF